MKPVVIAALALCVNPQFAVRAELCTSTGAGRLHPNRLIRSTNHGPRD